MAEKIVSPGVFTQENDLSFVPQGVSEIGAALIGPTVKGPPNSPTVVNSYAEFDQIFGSTFQSGSQKHSYLTSLTARSYLQHQGTLTVVRILAGSYTGASAEISSSTNPDIVGVGNAAFSTASSIVPTI